MTDFALRRLGTIMSPEPGNALEAEGVLNPAAARGRDGALYLFPRLVARDNYSRIGIARVKFGDNGDPVGVERLGLALEPEADYEKRHDGGGCEDPRVSYALVIDQYVMTYTAHSPHGPRIAIAVSDDLFAWRRVGLATFDAADGLSFDGVADKDACLFPAPVRDPLGRPALAMMHRPLFAGTSPEAKAASQHPEVCDDPRESIWLSYAPYDAARGVCPDTVRHATHRRIAKPAADWERLKIGGGTPPVLTRLGWLCVYHGVSACDRPTDDQPGDGPPPLRYSAGVLVLDADDPCHVLYRSPEPVLTPETPDEVGEGGGTTAKANVVFPTGIDRRDDLGCPDRFDVYYGMADSKVGVATLTLPDHL